MTDTLVRTTDEKRTSARREDLQSVTPHLVCAGAAEAMEFYKRAFGAVELMRLGGRDGRLMHGSIAIGRGDWQTRGETRTVMRADKTHFIIEASLDAYEGDKQLVKRRWNERIPRDFN